VGQSLLSGFFSGFLLFLWILGFRGGFLSLIVLNILFLGFWIPWRFEGVLMEAEEGRYRKQEAQQELVELESELVQRKMELQKTVSELNGRGGDGSGSEEWRWKAMVQEVLDELFEQCLEGLRGGEGLGRGEDYPVEEEVVGVETTYMIYAGRKWWKDCGGCPWGGWPVVDSQHPCKRCKWGVVLGLFFVLAGGVCGLAALLFISGSVRHGCSVNGAGASLCGMV
jgi:hypothetical protein